MTKDQERVITLLDGATPKDKLEPWIIGYIPKHYKRLTVSNAEARELAELGAVECYSKFGTVPFFTQALIMGAAMGGKYKELVIVTPSQYGKSWLCGQIAIALADKGQAAYVVGGDSEVTRIIMGKVTGHIQTADKSIVDKLIGAVDKIERLQTAISKTKLSFKGGGLVEPLSLGETFNDPQKGNNAIGRGGNFIIDEASKVSDDRYAELGRREFANVNGEKYLSIEISNPHNAGRFFDKLTSESVPNDRLIVWMDSRTALEENRIKSKEQIINSEFFANRSTCRRYLLCELEDYSAESLFPEPIIDDSEPEDITEYYLGVDSAYKGKDNIEIALTGRKEDGTLRILDHVTVHKGEWVDGVTGEHVVNTIMKVVRAYNVKMVCVDIGYGVYIVEGLARRIGAVKGINFGEGTTEKRRKAQPPHFAAVYGANKRAEMHLDLQDLMDNQNITFTSKMAEILKDELSATKGIHKTNGKIAIISKEEIKQVIGHSPDELDAVLLSIHASILHAMTEASAVYS